MINIEQKAEQLKHQLGGRIFAFPVNEEDPFSKYAVTMFTGDGKWHTYPSPLDISEAASGIKLLLGELEKEGHDADFEKNVRFVSYQVQVDAPSVTMRRLKKEQRSAGFVTGLDVIPKDGEEEEYNVSARGLIKFSYYSMIDDKLPKAIKFMDGYYELLSKRGYGKSAASIKREVRPMNKDEATRWIEKTYAKYIRDDIEIFNIMTDLKKES